MIQVKQNAVKKYLFHLYFALIITHWQYYIKLVLITLWLHVAIMTGVTMKYDHIKRERIQSDTAYV